MILWQPTIWFSLKFKLEYFWIGAFWKKEQKFYWDISEQPIKKIVENYLHVWVCVVPCLPLHFTFYKGETHA